jgi:uncharacterized protein YigA (DUF484 family)
MGLRRAEISPSEGLNVFLGGNAQGKSSLRQSVIYGLLGALSLKKKDEKFLIRNGEKAAEVSIELVDGLKILRRRTRSYCIKEGREPSFPLPRGILSILWSSPWQVVSWLSSKEGKSFLAATFGQNDPSALLKSLSKHGIDGKSNLLAPVVEAFKKGGQKAAFDEAVNLRREKKRELNAVKSSVVLPDPVITVNGCEINAEKWNVETLRQKQKDLEAQFQRLMEKKKISQVKETLEKEIKELKGHIAAGEEAIKKLETEIIQLSEKAGPIECPLVNKECPCPEFVYPNMSNMYEELKRKKQKFEEIKSKVELLKIQVQRKEEELKKLPAEAEELDSINSRVNELNRRLLNAAAVVAAVEQYQRQKERCAQLLNRADALQKEVEELDRVAKILDPSSSKLEIGRNGLDQLNELLSDWKDVLGFEVSVSPSFEFVLNPQRPLFLLSFSEIYRLGVAFIFALCHLTHVDVVFLDDAEVVVRSPQKKLIQKLSESGKQVFAFASTNMDKNRMRSTDKITLFWVEKGVVERI